MHTFKFSKCAWCGLYLDLRVFHSEGPDTYAVSTDVYGQIIVFVHVSITGKLSEDPRFIRSLVPDVVICCYPRLAKRLYPGLPIAGNWRGKTRVYGTGNDCLLHIEEKHHEA